MDKFYFLNYVDNNFLNFNSNLFRQYYLMRLVNSGTTSDVPLFLFTEIYNIRHSKLLLTKTVSIWIQIHCYLLLLVSFLSYLQSLFGLLTENNISLCLIYYLIGLLASFCISFMVYNISFILALLLISFPCFPHTEESFP